MGRPARNGAADIQNRNTRTWLSFERGVGFVVVQGCVFLRRRIVSSARGSVEVGASASIYQGWGRANYAARRKLGQLFNEWPTLGRGPQPGLAFAATRKQAPSTHHECRGPPRVRARDGRQFKSGSGTMGAILWESKCCGPSADIHNFLCRRVYREARQKRLQAPGPAT